MRRNAGSSSNGRSQRKGLAARAKASSGSRSATSARARRAPLSLEEARTTLAASKKLYYRIGEVSELTGVKAHVLRYWETEFRWMAPPKSRSKQRLYRKRDIELVWLLKRLLWEQRYTIAGARQRIAELGLDEALARAAESEALAPELLASFVHSDAAPGADFAGNATDVDGGLARAESAGRSNGLAPAAGGIDWSEFGAAIEAMKAELLTLRGTLLQGI